MNLRIPLLMAAVLVTLMGLLVVYEVKRDKPEQRSHPQAADPSRPPADPADPANAADPDAPPPPPAEANGRLQLAIFHLPSPRKDPFTALGPLKAQHNSLQVFESAGDAKDAKPPIVVVNRRPTTTYQVPNDTSLEHRARGLTDADKDSLRASREVTLLDITLPVPPLGTLHEAESLTLELADITGGFIWDEQTQDTFTRDAFRERRLETWEGRTPSVPSHVALFFDENEDGSLSLETGGMARFHLPELVLRGMSRGQLNKMGDVLNALMQRLVEQPELAVPGPITLTLSELRHAAQRESQLSRCEDNAAMTAALVLTDDASDPVHPRKLVVSLPGEGETAVAWEKVGTALYGSAETVQHIEHDAELIKVSKKAVAVLKKTIKPRFKRGLKPKEVLMVKAPFTTSAGGNEWMWVDVKTWKGDTIVGTLDSEPEDCPDLQAGDEVTVVEEDLFDWTLLQANGESLGNETGKLMQARLDAAKKKAAQKKK